MNKCMNSSTGDKPALLIRISLAAYLSLFLPNQPHLKVRGRNYLLTHCLFYVLGTTLTIFCHLNVTTNYHHLSFTGEKTEDQRS